MFLIKRIIITVSSILGACTGMIFLALLNAAFHFDLSFSQVSIYGIAGGLMVGIGAGYYFIYLMIKRAKKFVNQKLTGFLSKFAAMRRY
jgi:hypothetical protein